MLSSITNFADASATYIAQSTMTRPPQLPGLLRAEEPKNAKPATDVYERADGSQTTRNDSISEREKAEQVRRRLDAQALESKKEKPESDDDKRFRDVLHQFVGQTLFGQMLKSMRATQEKNPLLDGGRAEEIFQSQLDMVLTDQMTKASSRSLSDPMYKLMKAPRNIG